LLLLSKHPKYLLSLADVCDVFCHVGGWSSSIYNKKIWAFGHALKAKISFIYCMTLLWISCSILSIYFVCTCSFVIIIFMIVYLETYTHERLWRPKTGTLQIIAITPQSIWCRFRNAPPSASCMSQHARDAGGIKVATVTQVHDGTHKRIYNNHEDSTSQESKIYIQSSKSYIKQNSIRVRIRIQMGLRGLKINDGVHNPAQAKPEG
jgi:hypothetical protein